MSAAVLNRLPGSTLATFFTNFDNAGNQRHLSVIEFVEVILSASFPPGAVDCAGFVNANSFIGR